MNPPTSCPSCNATLTEVNAVGELDQSTMQVDVRCPECNDVFRVVIDRTCTKCNVLIPDEAADGLCAMCRD